MNTIRQRFRMFLLASVVITAVVAFAQADDMKKGDLVDRAVAVLHPTEGNRASGTVTFTQVGDQVQVAAIVNNLTPGRHGFHIHEWGDCSAPDGTSAGGHYNPDGNPHAGPGQRKRHVGDLGNLEADGMGNAEYQSTDGYVMLNGPHSIVGRAVVVHAGEDDLTSQPTGDAGSRVACGVIGILRQ